MQAPQSVVVPTVKHGFEESRRKLVDVFAELVFMRVAVVSFPKSDVRSGTHFQGEAIEVFAGRSHRAPRVAFFSRFGRQTGTGFNLLGVTIVDTPLGPSHASATPQVGDIIVGSLMPAAKGKLPFEIRGWSAGGKPLLELSRVVQYGTRMSESELKRQLRQPCAETAASLLRLSTSLSPAEIAHAKLASSCADELWVLVRIVCFGNLEDPGDARLGGKSFVDMVDMIATRFGDEVLLDSWAKIRPHTVPQAFPQQAYTWAPSNVGPSGTPLQSPTPSPPRLSNLTAFLSKLAPVREAYDPAKTVYDPAAYAPASYSPASPKPASPKAPQSPQYAPASPPYTPASPMEGVSYEAI
jgi:hypothetical protein